MSCRHRFMPGLLALAGACVLAGCSTRTPAPSVAQAPEGAMAAVFARLFIDNASALGPKAAAFCIGYGQGWALSDPDAATLSATRALGALDQVRPASECDMGKRGEHVLDKASGAPALLFGVNPVHCTLARECIMRGSYYESSTSTQANLYRVRMQGGAWVVSMALRGPAPE